MTKLLVEVMRKVAEMPDERQDDAARVLLSMLENDASTYRLSDEQLHEVELAIAEVADGKVATDKEMRETWRNFGA
jgi:hypothetical protein